MFPLESPVMMSPFSLKQRHTTNFGRSTLCKHQLRPLLWMWIDWNNWNYLSSRWGFLVTSKEPGTRLSVSELPSSVQNVTLLLPHVIMRLGTEGWNSQAKTASGPHYKYTPNSTPIRIRGRPKMTSASDIRSPPLYLSATRPKWSHTLSFKLRPPISQRQPFPPPPPPTPCLTSFLDGPLVKH